MSDAFLELLVLYPHRKGNLDVSAINRTVIESRWKAMVKAYSSCVATSKGKKTGNGVNNDSDVMAKCKFFDRLQVILGKDNPQFSPSRTRNGGKVDKARCVESYLSQS